jgi:tetratricopeptide (TPR) repeat protein
MDRITNESNLWLNAIKADDEGNYLEAFLFYLQDSSECLKQNSLVRAALSCSCAANCLVMTGNLSAARQLYKQTATIYENNANSVIGNSVREALWSYQEAYEYYNLACEDNQAEHVYEKHVSLSRKVNPFVGEKEAMESLRVRKIALETNSKLNQTSIHVSADIDNAIKNFMNEIGSTRDELSPNILQRVFKKISEVKTSEKSIAN